MTANACCTAYWAIALPFMDSYSLRAAGADLPTFATIDWSPYCSTPSLTAVTGRRGALPLEALALSTRLRNAIDRPFLLSMILRTLGSPFRLRHINAKTERSGI